MSELHSVLDDLAAAAPTEQSSWADVVSRARRAKARRLAVTASAAAAILALAIPALGISGRLTDLFAGKPVRADELSSEQLHVLGAMAAGVSPRVPASVEESLARAGAADLRRIATRGGRSYYVANRAGGGLCVTITYAGDRNPFVGYTCSPDFPSPKRPVLDKSVFGGSPDAPVVRRLEGFAADGVASIEVVTVGGTRASTGVKDNVYVRTDDLPNEAVRSIVARDAHGSAIYTWCLLRGGCGG